MINAIAEKLQALTKSEATITQFSHLNRHWQEKIKRSLKNNPESVFLICPHNVATLALVVKTAQQERWQIIPSGNGSKLDWGGIAEDVRLIVSTQKCDRIIEHAVDDLTITVEAGIKFVDLQAKLKLSNQFLPIDPAFADSATIGGILATADTGSLRQRYGGIRDLVLGISFVRGDGEIAKAGGRVVKNVAGYDLMKLFIGSYGTLGIISEVTFRTYPIPEASQTVIITGKNDALDKAIRLLKNSGLTPSAADLITASVAKKLEIGENAALLWRFQTIQASIEAQYSQLTAMLAELDVEIVTRQGESEQTLWEKLTDLIRIPTTSEATICKFGALPTTGVELLATLEATQSQNYALMHLGSGIGVLQIRSSIEPSMIKDIRTFCHQNGGFLSVLTAPNQIKQNIDIWGYGGNGLEMMKTIKQKFDPQQIFNSDRYIV